MEGHALFFNHHTSILNELFGYIAESHLAISLTSMNLNFV